MPDSHQETPEQIHNTLSQFFGTENYYRLYPGWYLTDGAHYLSQACGAFWLLDILYSARHFVSDDVTVMTLTLTVKDTAGKVVITNGGEDVIYTQDIAFTDFPLDEISIWAELGSLDGQTSAWIVLLPSEH